MCVQQNESNIGELSKATLSGRLKSDEEHTDRGGAKRTAGATDAAAAHGCSSAEHAFAELLKTPGAPSGAVIAPLFLPTPSGGERKRSAPCFLPRSTSRKDEEKKKRKERHVTMDGAFTYVS